PLPAAGRSRPDIGPPVRLAAGRPGRQAGGYRDPGRPGAGAGARERRGADRTAGGKRRPGGHIPGRAAGPGHRQDGPTRHRATARRGTARSQPAAGLSGAYRYRGRMAIPAGGGTGARCRLALAADPPPAAKGEAGLEEPEGTGGIERPSRPIGVVAVPDGGDASALSDYLAGDPP